MNYERPLEVLDIKSDQSSLSIRWSKWLKTLELYLLATNVTNAERKCATLLYLAGPDTQEVYETLTALENEDGKDAFEICVGRLSAYFTPKRNKTYERHIFRNIVQMESETVDQFCTRLKSQAQFCEFRDQTEDNIKDQIVDKCRSNTLRVKVLEKGDDISLEGILQLARSMEISETQARNMVNTSKVIDSQSINSISRSGRNIPNRN